MADNVDTNPKKPDKPKAANKTVMGLMWPLAEKVGLRKKPAKEIDDDWLRTAIERADEAYNADRHNIEAAYEDLQFEAGDQWPDYAKRQREAEERPMLTENNMPQYISQVTGEIDQNMPQTTVVPVDAKASKEVATILKGMLRYIRNRSEAEAAYSIGADQQVSCGIGHMQVTTEYASEETSNQECRILQVNDGISVLWDANAVLPVKEDATHCFVPMDFSPKAFKAKWPDVSIEDFNSYDKKYSAYWSGSDFVRTAVYWEKRPFERTLAIYKDGSTSDVTDKPKALADAKAKGAKIRKRPGHKVFRSLITLGAILEPPEEWKGRHIPVVPLIGREIRIGRKIIRFGIIRFAKDGQIRLNVAISTEAEIAGLQPKAPWLGTKKNFEASEDKWATANSKSHPYLEYVPDPLNSGQAPQRVAPPVSSGAISTMIERAKIGIQSAIGIYNASLGAKSNETSGVAIEKREEQSDTGTVRYVKNMMHAQRQIDRIILDLVPHIYDTERMVQVLDEKGELESVVINKAIVTGRLAPEGDDPIQIGHNGGPALGDEPDQEIASDGDVEPAEKPIDEENQEVSDADRDEVDDGSAEDAENGDGEFAGEPTTEDEDEFGEPGDYMNDVTIGLYDVVVKPGPSYASKLDEAKDGMREFIKASPEIAPLVMDLYAKAQDWPMADDIAKRIEAMLPPPIRAMIEAERAKKEIAKAGPDGQVDPKLVALASGQPPGPSPQEQAAQEVAQKVALAEADSKVRVAQAHAATEETKKQIADIELGMKRLEAHVAEVGKQESAGNDASVVQSIIDEVATLHGMVSAIMEQLPAPIEQPTEQPPAAAPAPQEV